MSTVPTAGAPFWNPSSSVTGNGTYRSLGIPCRIEPDIPTRNSLPSNFDNLVEYARFFRRFAATGEFRQRLAAEVGKRFDVVHLNHEGLWWLGRWLSKHTNTAIVQHVRTRPEPTPFARWQARSIARSADHVVFITENEQRHFAALGAHPQASVIYNVPVQVPDAITPHPEVPVDDRLKVAALSNYSYMRGVDRLVELAEELAKRGRRDILFVVAGDMKLDGSLPGGLGEVGAKGGTLEDFAARRGVAEYFLFLGHVNEPERVVLGCDLVAKLTREANPWGRDIIEALGLGRPVVTLGTWNKLVEHGRTGFIFPEFDGPSVVEGILRLADDRELCRRLGDAGRERIATLCNGPERAAQLLEVWQQARKPKNQRKQKEDRSLL
jgi:glycosyltransferase involved in cell wall biosynthesis